MPVEASSPQILKHLVGFLERITRRPNDDTDLGRQNQEVDAILPHHVRDRQNPAFFPQEVVRERSGRLHLYPGAHDAARSPADGFECLRHQIARGGEDNCRTLRLRRHLVRAASPSRRPSPRPGCAQRKPTNKTGHDARGEEGGGKAPGREDCRQRRVPRTPSRILHGIDAASL